MLFIGYNLFNIGHCIFFLLFVSILKKKSPSYLSCCCHAVYLRTDISQLTVFWSRFLLAAVVDHVRCWSCSECSRGTKQLMVDMLWRLLLLCATDCCPIRVFSLGAVTYTANHVEMFQTLHLLVVTCSDVFWSLLLPLWSEELSCSCVLTCFPQLLICLDIPYLSLSSYLLSTCNQNAF